MSNYWRLEQDYSKRDIENMTNSELHDLVIDIRLAVKDKEITKSKALDLLILVSSELIKR